MNKIIMRYLSICVLWFPIAGNAGSTDTEYLERAQNYLNQGELQAATIELKNALRQNAGNAKARSLLGKLYLETGNAPAAEKELRHASELGDADDVVLPLMAQALLAQGKLEELQQLSLENLTTNNPRSLVLAAQGLGKLAQMDVDAASEQIHQAVSQDPQSPYAGVAKARLLAAKEEYGLARQELDRVFALDADFAPAWSLLGGLETQGNNLAKAEVAYTKATQNRADIKADLLRLALIHIKQKKYEEAQRDIDILQKQAPNNPQVNYAQGLIHFNNNRLAEARDAFALSLKSSNDSHLQAAFHMALTQMYLGNQQQAKQYGNNFLTAFPNSISGRKLMASIEFRDQQYAKTEELIRPVIAIQEDDVAALDLLANALLGQGKMDEAIVLLEKVASLQPDSADAQLRLAVGLLANGQQSEGIAYIKNALEMDPQLERANILLVQAYMKQKEFDKATVAAEDYRNRHPASVEPYNLIGQIKLITGQWADAAEAFNRAREIAPGDPEANHKLAALAIRSKAYQDARNYYQEVLEQHQNHLSTLLKLAALDGMEKNRQAMLDHIQQAQAAHPNSVQPKVVLARYYIIQGEPEKVSTLMLNLSEEQKRTRSVLEVMAMSQLDQQQFNAARKSLEQLIQIQPKLVQAHYMLARAYAGLGDRDGLREELEKTVEFAPRSFAARLALARLLLLEGQKEEFNEHLAVLNELSPDHPDLLQLKAALAQAQGDQGTATALLEDVFEKSPSTASMLSVARQKWATGDQAAALELQEQWTAEHPKDIAASLALAKSYSQQDQIEHAITQYQQILKVDEKNVDALNNLAWYWRDKQPEKALEYAERAAKLAPGSFAVMDTLAVVQLKNGDIKRAKRNIEKLLDKMPKNPVLLYHRAMIDAASGDKASAIQTLQALLTEGSDFSEKKEAQQLLATLQAGGG